MVEGAWSRRLDRMLVVFSSLFGTVPMAVLGSACVARILPLSEEARLAVALTLIIPFWVAATCFVFLVKSAARAVGLCLAVCALFAAIAYGLPH